MALSLACARPARAFRPIEIGADVVAGPVQHLPPKPLGDFRSITRCVMTGGDRRISRPGNRRTWRGAFGALPHDIQSTALRKLRILNNAKVLQDLAVPPNKQLEALKGDRAGQHSIRINRQRRICFVWTTGGPDRVEIVDYH
jgi:toxin HigB-1